MSFWDKAGNLAKGLISEIDKSLTENAAEWTAAKEKMAGKTSEELKKIIESDGFFGASRKEKAAAFKELKNRGEIPN